ncbi:iron-siderophore ABC transporter substrate-binding protein [Oerskovia sp. NPDC060287]|uniref:iron-siderophore ABC transporter substrate-binding protein n=1 Tax=Oerskovia sp. NPDC060287 TaxID=3347095 RepID=UPI0036625E4A
MTPTSSRRRTAPRRLLGAVASLVTLAALAACSTAGTDDSASPAPAGGGDIATTTLAEADAFPVSIDHAYGSTTIEDEPQRVVTIGWSSQDAVVAFGKVPVGIEKFSGPGIEDDILPWLTDTFEGATPELLTSNPDVPFEQIAALRPDVIIAVYSGITDTAYERLSEIAPTVAFPGSAWETSWQDQTTMIGAALGQPARADELVEGVGTTVAETAAAHPELQGRTITYAMNGEGGVIVFCPSDPRIELLTQVGLEPSPGTLAVCGAEDASSVSVSSELIPTLDADAFILIDVDETVYDTLLGNPLFAALPSVADGRVVRVVGMDYAMATSAPTVLSIPYALDEFVAQLTTTLG